MSATSQPIVVVKPQRSLCSRLVASVLMCVGARTIFYAIISSELFALYVVMPAEYYGNAVKEFVAPNSIPNCCTANLTVPFSEVSYFVGTDYSAMSALSSVPRSTVLALAAFAVAVTTLFTAYMCSADFRLVFNMVLFAVGKLASELYYGVPELCKYIATLDYQALFESVVVFCRDVFAEMRSFFVANEHDEPIVQDVTRPGTYESHVIKGTADGYTESHTVTKVFDGYSVSRTTEQFYPV